MTKNVTWWGGMWLGILIAVGCDQLERKPKANPVEPEPVVVKNNWNKVATPAGKITKLALGYDHSCALYEDGVVACWGGNAFGQLGISSEKKTSFEPTIVKEAPAFRDIVAGDSVTCGVVKDDNRELRCWGKNTFGQLGLAGNGTSSDGKLVTIMRDKDVPLAKVNRIYANYNSICAITDEDVLCWGDSPYVYEGKDPQGSPTRVLGRLSGEKAKVPTKVNAVASSDGFGPAWDSAITIDLAILKDEVCGIIDSKLRCLKTKIEAEDVESISGNDAALYFTKTTDHDLYKATLKIADGSYALSTVENLPDDKKLVSVGRTHACTLINNNEAYCWGDKSFGQLGFDGLAAAQNVYALTNLHPVLMAAGTRHNCAIDKDGVTWCWGSNDQGQTGSEPKKRARVMRVIPTQEINPEAM